MEVIYVVVMRVISGILVSVLLFYKNFCGDLGKKLFESNPYNPCVAIRVKVGKQHTVGFYVDNVIFSHVSPKVYDNF